MMRRARMRAAILVAALALTATGCQIPGQFFAWAFAPRHPKQTVKAEYELKAERLVIVPYVGTDVLFSYPAAPLEISTDIVHEILLRIPDRVKMIIHPVQVIQWQESNLEWPSMSLVRVAEMFQADTLMYVEVERYSMIEERSANLFRGRIKARVQVVETTAARNPVWEDLVEMTFPEDSPVGVLDVSERTIRAGVTRLFAREVVRRFHDHEIEAKGGGT